MTLGVVLQKYLKLPWQFTVVISGVIFANLGLFPGLGNDPVFLLFQKIGIYCLLFIIGLSIDFKEFRKMAKEIFVGNFITCLFEGFGLSLLFYFVFPTHFSNSYLICLLTGIGFATIGEVILIAILTELKIEKSKFGQLTIGMGVADDIVELIVLTFVSTLPFFYGTNGSIIESDLGQIFSIWLLLIISILIILGITLISIKMGKSVQRYLMKLGKNFPHVLGVLYLTIFLGMIVISVIFIEEISILGAIFAGIICKSIFPEKNAEKLEGNFKFLMLFIAPFFFFGVGYHVSLSAIMVNVLLIFVIIIVSIVGRVGSTMFVFKKHFKKISDRLTFGFGLCTKFSTSIIVLSLLLEYGYITIMIYSLIITAFLTEKVIVVFVYSFGITRLSKQLTEQPSLELSQGIPVKPSENINVDSLNGKRK